VRAEPVTRTRRDPDHQLGLRCACCDGKGATQARSLAPHASTGAKYIGEIAVGWQERTYLTEDRARALGRAKSQQDAREQMQSFIGCRDRPRVRCAP
jgi:hypothetical protein